MTTVHYRFERDSFTWLAYVMLAYYAFLQSSLGPLMPFLAAQLNMSYTVRGLHLSAFALGMMLAGTMADRAARRLGRRRVFWGGGVGMALAALALTTAGTSVVSIACAFLMGFIGSFLLVMIQATLADHHGLLRAVALTEANVGASVAAALAPLLVSQSEAAGTGWRVALVLGAAAWAVVFAWRWRMPITEAPPVAESHAGPRRLPRQFWMYWLVVLLIEELDAAIADGWHVSLPEAYAAREAALAPKPLDIPAPVLPEPEAIPDDNAPPTRAEMIAKADELGIKVDARWSDKTLLAKIEEALAAS